jgi:hypothetical protein
MRLKRNLVRYYEVCVTILCSYLAVKSLLSLAILGGARPLLSALLLPTAALSLVALYGLLLTENTKIFRVHFLMYLPGALSHSIIGWDIERFYTTTYEAYRRSPQQAYLAPVSYELVTITVPQYTRLSLDYFTTRMTYPETLFTGLLLIAGYISILLLSKTWETQGELESRGETPEKARHITYQQFKLLLSFIAISLGAAVGLAYATDIAVMTFESMMPASEPFYIVLSLTAALTLIGSLVAYVKKSV